MARGLPDYGQASKQYAIAGMADLGEAVARLNSINIFDRKGFTIWQDDFEAPVLRWYPTSGGAGANPILSTAIALSGVQCVYLNAPAGVGSYSQIGHTFPVVRLGNFGMEFAINGFTKTPGYFRAIVHYANGVTQHYAELRYDTNARTMSIVTPAGVQLIATNIWMENILRWYFLPIKLVIDIDNNLYIRLVVGPEEVDLSSHSLNLLAPATSRFIWVYLTVIASAADDMWMYLDNFIHTQAEP